MATKEEVKRYLGDAAPEQCFWVNNGPILKNMDELANAFLQMSNETFKHHVNSDKNDFSAWVNDVFGDKKLANDLLSSKNKISAAKKVTARLASVKKRAG